MPAKKAHQYLDCCQSLRLSYITPPPTAGKVLPLAKEAVRHSAVADPEAEQATRAPPIMGKALPKATLATQQVQARAPLSWVKR